MKLVNKYDCIIPEKLLSDYYDLQELSTSEPDIEPYYLTYSARSVSSNQLCTIRALDRHAQLTMQDYDAAATLFVQELLHLYYRDPHTVLLDTFTISQGKMAFVTSTSCNFLKTQKTSQIDLTKMIDNLVKDIHFFSDGLRMRNITKLLRPESIFYTSDPEPTQYCLSNRYQVALPTIDETKKPTTTNALEEAKTNESTSNWKSDLKDEEFYTLGLMMLKLLNGDLICKKIENCRSECSDEQAYHSAVDEILSKAPLTESQARIFSTMLQSDAHKLEKLEELLQTEGLNQKKELQKVNVNPKNLPNAITELLEDPNPKESNGIYIGELLVGDVGVLALSQSQQWSHVTEMDLTKNLISDLGAEVLSKCAVWNNLEGLYLDTNSIGSAGAVALSRNRTWTKLKFLSMMNNTIGDEGAAALSMNDSWTNLEILNLEINAIGDAGIEQLSKNSTWKNLKDLYLKDNSITGKGASALSKNNSWTKLTVLELSGNNIGTGEDVGFAQNTSWVNLSSLYLDRNAISDNFVIALSENSTWKNLELLGLDGNLIGEDGAKALSKNISWQKLERLSLGGNAIREGGAEALSKNSCWTNLNYLNLRENSIGERGAEALSKNTSWINLREFDLNTNKLGEAGAEALSNNSSWVCLSILHLEGNGIYEGGATALCKNTHWKDLSELNLKKNPINKYSIEAIKAACNWRKEFNLEC